MATAGCVPGHGGRPQTVAAMIDGAGSALCTARDTVPPAPGDPAASRMQGKTPCTMRDAAPSPKIVACRAQPGEAGRRAAKQAKSTADARRLGPRPAWPFTAGIALPALASLADAVAHVPSACIGLRLRLQFLACFLACRTRPQGRPAAALMPEPHAPVGTAASHRTAGHTGAAGIAAGEAEPLAPVPPSPTGHAARPRVQPWRQNPMHLRNCGIM